MKFSFGFGLVCFGCMIAAIACLQIYLYNDCSQMRSKAIASWSKTRAIVVEVNRSYAWRRGGETIITYRYEVNGNSYDSDRTSFFDKTHWIEPRDSDESSAIVYPGVHIDVLVDPLSPADSVRLPNDPSDVMVLKLVHFYVWILGGGGLGVVCGLGLVGIAVRTALIDHAGLKGTGRDS